MLPSGVKSAITVQTVRMRLLVLEGVCVSKAEVSMSHLIRVFTKPEQVNSKLAQIEQHISDNLADFLSQHVVAKKTSLEEIEKDFDSAVIPDIPDFVSTHAEALLEKLVAHSVNTYSPTFIGHMTSALPYFHLPLAKLMVGLNQNLVKIETSKAFTPLERQVLGIMHNVIYQQPDGFYDQHLHSARHSLGAFCSGGTVANMTALWVARNNLLGPQPGFPGVSRTGLMAAYQHYGIDGIGVVSSKRGHYSLGKAMDLLGVGRNEMIMIDCPSQTLSPEKALQAGLAYQQQGKKLLAVVGVAGTTETGHIDPLDELADVAKELGCWFHVDAAWGGATLFSERYRNKLIGIEKADSVTIDAHKQMYVPMGAGMVLFKDPQKANAVRHHAQYILREGSKDLGATTLEGSRNGMAMLVYASLHILGRQGYELLVNQSIEKARRFADMIDQEPNFELVTKPTLSLLTYRVVPQGILALMNNANRAQRNEINDVLNKLVVNVQKRQREAGKSFVSRTRLTTHQYADEAITVFRVVLANPLTTGQDLHDILAEQIEIAQQCPQWQTLMALTMPQANRA